MTFFSQDPNKDIDPRNTKNNGTCLNVMTASEITRDRLW
jgi:hypothetical protein